MIEIKFLESPHYFQNSFFLTKIKFYFQHMTTKDFSQLFPEILNPAASLSNLKALCRSKKFPEDEFASCLHDFSLIRNNYPGYMENPGGYLNTTIDNSIKKYFRGGKIDFSDTENLSDTVVMDDFDIKSIQRKLDDFIRGIHKLNLPTNQRRLIEEMVVICENDHKTHKDFIKEVREAQARHGVTNFNFRKLLERLKNNLKGNDGLKDMLSFIPTDDQNINELIELLLTYIDLDYRINEIMKEFALPESLVNQIKIIVKVALERINYITETTIEDYQKEKYNDDIETVISGVLEIENSPTSENLKIEPSILIEISIYVLLLIRGNLNAEFITILKNKINGYNK